MRIARCLAMLAILCGPGSAQLPNVNAWRLRSIPIASLSACSDNNVLTYAAATRNWQCLAASNTANVVTGASALTTAGRLPYVSAAGILSMGAWSGQTHLLVTPDNTYDIGASGATRPRDLYLGRTAYVGTSGSIGTTGALGTLTLFKANAGALGGSLVLDNNNGAVGDQTAIIFSDGNGGALASFARAQIVSTVEGAPYYGNLGFWTGSGSLGERLRITGAGLINVYYALQGTSAAPAVNAASCTGATIGTGATNLAGTITGLPTGSCSVVITFASATAAHGWSCAVSDQTTANLFRQTASGATTVTLAGTSVSGDVLAYGPCVGF